jgi:tetratricopeptide (TPR) repeat protein
MMDHPNIAKVLDAGATEAGRPYFVMELVRGIRITDYCDQYNLSIRDRLDLCIKVCQAIQHAHQKGIIHRDIKPSNILVTLHDGVPVSKVIDFGIAKATEGRLTDATVYTQLHQFIGTPAYMSPEQAEMSGLDIDTRSDLYSLGVLLYELLTGQTPFSNEELMRAGLEEMRRTIREKEPVRPSTRLKMTAALDLAKRRGESREKLAVLIRGDLDWIVMKCLEKDRTRRYQAANELAAELQRYLHNEPVLARPPSAAYRFQKLVRRNRLAFAATAAVGVALLVGVTATSWQAIRATRAEQQQKQLRQQAEQNALLAQVEAGKSKQVASFLREMLRGVRPSVALGRDVTVLREIVDRATARLDKDLNDQPAVQATLQNTLGQIYRELGEYDQAERLLSKALGVRRQLLGETNTEVAATMHELGEVLRERNRLGEAEKLHRHALAIREQVLGTENEQVPASLGLLAKTLWERGQLQEAEVLLRQALAIEKKLHGAVHLDVASCLQALGSTLQQAGNLAEAERIYNEALALCERPIGADVLKPILLKDLASVRTTQKRPMEGIELLRRSLPLFGKLFQTNNADPEVTASFERMNKLFAEHGDKVPLEELMTNVLAIQRKLTGNRNPELAASLQILGTTAQNQGRPAEAEKSFRESLEMRRRLWGEEHPLVASTMASLASALIEQGKLTEAEGILVRRLEISRTLYATDLSKLDRPLLELADVWYRQGKYAQAEPLYRELIKLRAEHPTPGVGSRTDLMASLGRLLADWALLERAAPVSRERAREAEKLLRDCLAARVGATNVSRTKLGDTRSRLGGAVLSMAVCDPALNPDRFKEAETLLLTGHELMQADSPISPRYVRDSLQRLIRLYDAWKSVAPDADYEAKAATWKQRLEQFEKPRNAR